MVEKIQYIVRAASAYNTESFVGGHWPTQRAAADYVSKLIAFDYDNITITKTVTTSTEEIIYEYKKPQEYFRVIARCDPAISGESMYLAHGPAAKTSIGLCFVHINSNVYEFTKFKTRPEANAALQKWLETYGYISRYISFEIRNVKE